MKLYASLTSPYARKIRIVLLEKKIDCHLIPSNPWEADTVVPEFNPLGKVPVLQLDDGTALYDSRVIAEYLDNVSPVGKLLPAENRPLALAKRWEALADGVLDAAITVFLEKKRPAAEQSPAWMERQLGKVERGLAALAHDLDERPWCYGSSFTLADIAVGSALGWLSLRFPALDWRSAHPNLAALYDKLSQRPSFVDTVPPAV